jgi:hypothetical protein
MGAHGGPVYWFIPLGYACLFVLLLVATIVWSFSRTRRHIADCLLTGTLMTVPGIVLAWLLFIPYSQWVEWTDRAWHGRWIDPKISLAIILMPFLIALACVAGSFWFGASLAMRRRKRRRGRPQHEKSLHQV